MIFYLVRRLIGAIPTLFLLAVATFFLLRFAPGGPFDSERAFPPEVMANIERKYGLDQPLATQFATWLGDLARGDLRESFQYLGRPVSEIIGEALPYSLWLGFLALVVSVAIGIPLGALAAWRAGTWLDFSAMAVAISGISLPGYLVASLLILVFSLQLGWFPPALWEGAASLVLPVVTLASRPMAIIARLTRASVLEALRADYIRSARAKGVTEATVVFHHALRNSLIPVVTVLGPIASHLITGSFLVEVVFQLPGLGKHFVQAVLNRDYPLVMGVTLVYGAILILCNLIVDMLYGYIDPRVRVSG